VIRASLLVVTMMGCVAPPTDDPGTAPGGGKADEDSEAAPKGSISVEVDYIGYQRFEPQTLDVITHYFDSIGYEITFEQGDVLEPVDVIDYGSTSRALRDDYVQHFAHRGQSGWHYMLMADTLANGNRGWGMLGGDIFVIADERDANPDHPLEAQVNIILHELGHNLGLVHEGFEPELAAGTHSKATCATADRAPAPDVPVMFYSPNCVEHIQLASKPYVPE
jgi:hypothetical protein